MAEFPMACGHPDHFPKASIPVVRFSRKMIAATRHTLFGLESK